MYKRILIGLDGSACSSYGGRIALTLAERFGADLVVAHIFSSELHAQRFRDMEDGLPEKYQNGQVKLDLRESHNCLIVEGFDSLSQGYLEGLVAEARQAGITVSPVAMAGRNYVKLLALAETRRADLIVLGAHGVGALNDGLLGSTVARVLRHSTCDVLIARDEVNGQAVMAGIDGSELAMRAATTAVGWADALNAPLQLVAAYDPEFHTEVFRTMARSLPAERQEQVGLDKQEGLHEEIINAGLAELYRGFLDDARRHLGSNGKVESVLLEGKAYRAIVDSASESKASLVVVGRFGNHRESGSLIGSNAELIAANCSRNVLVTGDASKANRSEPKELAELAEAPREDTPVQATQIQWDSDAIERLGRIPSFARPMAKRKIEDAVRAQGSDKVDLLAFDQVASRYHMGSRGGGNHGQKPPS